MSKPSDNGALRMTPEQKLIKQVHELCMNYLQTGGNNAYLIGMNYQLIEFWKAPDVFNAMKQAEQMFRVRTDAVATAAATPDAESPRLSP